MEMCMTTGEGRKVTFGIREWIGVCALVLSALGTMVVVVASYTSIINKQSSMSVDVEKNTGAREAHSQILVRIEGSRFTSADGLDVWREIATIKERMAAIPTEVPPEWFKDYVNSLVTRLDRIEVRLGQMEQDSRRKDN